LLQQANDFVTTGQTFLPKGNSAGFRPVSGGLTQNPLEIPRFSLSKPAKRRRFDSAEKT